MIITKEIELILKSLQNAMEQKFFLRNFLEDFVYLKLESIDFNGQYEVITQDMKISRNPMGDFTIKEYDKESGITLDKPLFKTEQGFIVEFNPGIWLFKL